MRVLHLISSGGMYGAEAVILNLSHVFQQAGDTSVIASFSNASTQLHERALAEGLPSALVAASGQFSASTLSAIREVVKAERVDVLHAHGYKADLYAWAALRRSGVALVSTCHTWYDNDFAVRVYGALDRSVLRCYHRVVAVSAEVERRLLSGGVAAKKIRRIRNGIDLDAYAELARTRGCAENRPLRVGLVGRLAREKGVDIFIDAVAIVAASAPEVEFVVVGEGPDRPQLEEQIQSRGLTKRLQLLGHQGAMSSVYASLDLLVSASRQEGLPIALLEGMASGLPLVGTRVGEVPVAMVPGQTGVLVEAGSPDALAEAMLQVLSDDAQRLALGRNARAYMEQEFSAERMARDYRGVYQEAVRSSGSGR